MNSQSFVSISVFTVSSFLLLHFSMSMKSNKAQISQRKENEGMKPQQSRSREVSKGSFLLKSVGEPSAAAKILSKEKRNDISSLSEEIGNSLIKIHDDKMGPNLSLFYKNDGGLVVTRGEGVYLIDLDGNKYLDCCNNVACVGHSHPAVVAAGIKSLSEIQTNSRFLHPIRYEYVSKLLKTFPPELNTVYLVNSGSEANDLALRIARAHSKASKYRDVIVLDSAYHGHTQSLVEISPYKWYQAVDGKNYQPDTTHVVSCPDSYRGKYRGFSVETGLAYAKEVEDVIAATNGVGTFIAESIVGCGGQIMMPPGYLPRVYEVVRAAGGVCIADEVQTGFARAGSHFWMFQAYNVIPDIVTCGKPMGNGYPIAAVICRREVADSFAKSGIEYFNTYGGNSVGCTIAEKVLDTIHEEKLQKNAYEVGEYLKVILSPLINKYEWVGDVRGQGLFQGIEFVRSNKVQDLQPFPELAKFVVDFLRHNRIIISRDGPDENVIKMKPPLVFSKKNADEFTEGLDRALAVAKASNIFS